MTVLITLGRSEPALSSAILAPIIRALRDDAWVTRSDSSSWTGLPFDA